MLAQSKAFSGFAVDDLEQARDFYGETLGLEVELIEDPGLLTHPPRRRTATPSSIPNPTSSPPPTRSSTSRSTTSSAAVDGLTDRGVAFERYEGMEQDERGICPTAPAREIAWFKDPAGNILAVLRGTETESSEPARTRRRSAGRWL